MGAVDRPLRLLVEKWFGESQDVGIRVFQFKREGLKERSHICTEASSADGLVRIVFFLHDDGIWRVFPPLPIRPSMSIST